MSNDYWKIIKNWNEQNKTWFWGGIGGVIITLIITVSITIYSNSGKQNPSSTIKKNNISGSNNNTFNNTSGDVNIITGKNANINKTVNNNPTIIQGIPPAEYQRLSKDLGVTENAVKNFFKIINQKEVSKEDLDATLRKIAKRHKELLSKVTQYENFIDPDIQELRKKAEQAIEIGEYDKADTYFDEAFDRQMVCIKNAKKQIANTKKQLINKEEQLTNCELSAAEMRADKGSLESIRLNYKAAIKLFKEAVELVPDGHDFKKNEYLIKLGDAERDAGFDHHSQERYAEAEPFYQRALSTYEKVFGKENHTNLPLLLNSLAESYKYQGKYAEAEPLYQRSLGILEKEFGENQTLAIFLNAFAELYDYKGKYEKAEPLYKRSLEIYKKENVKDHPSVAKTLNNLAGLYESQGKYAEAEPLYQRALSIYEKVFGKINPYLERTINNLAELYMSQGKYEKAEPLYERSVKAEYKRSLYNQSSNIRIFNMGTIKNIYTPGSYKINFNNMGIFFKSQSKDHPSMATSFNKLAILYYYQGKYTSATLLYKKGLEINEKALGKDHPDVAEIHNKLAEEAETLYKRRLKITEKKLGKDHPDVATTLNGLAGLYESQGRYADAKHFFHKSLGIVEKSLGKDHPDAATTLNCLAGLFESQGKYADAEHFYHKSLGIVEKSLGKDHPSVATILNKLAGLYMSQGKYAEAEPLFQRCLGIVEKAFGK